MEEQQDLRNSATIAEPGWPSAQSFSRRWMERSDLLRLRDLLEEKTGLYLSVEKLDRLEELFADHSGILRSIPPQQVIHAINAGSIEGATYLNSLVDVLATNETYFFRTLAHFEALRDYLLPELVQAKRSRGEKTLRIWSAGCATGEEPYSLAILLLGTVPNIDAWEVTILATDIDIAALEKAREGVYRPWSFREMEPHIIEKYFRRKSRERYRIEDRIRSSVTFRTLNLKSDLYPSPLTGTTDLDIILCRNVTIYFRPETTERIVRRFHACLDEGGFLLTGAAEYSPKAYRDFEVRVFPETIIYQKAPFQKKTSSLKLAPLLLPVRESPKPLAPKRRIEHASAQKNERRPVDEALDLISQGEIDKALVLLAGLTEKNPKDSRVCFLLGQISADRHHLSEASHWLSRTLALDPLHLWAHYLLGLLWIEEGKIDEAFHSFKKAVYIDPNFVLGHFYLGRIYKEQGHKDKARKSLAVARNLLSSTSLSDALQGAEGMTAQQLLTLVDRELNYEG